MSFSFLTKNNLKEKYQQAKTKFEPNFEPFVEYERVADAEPKNIKPGQPDVTDATTASFLETRPMAIVQQSPTGKVKLEDGDEELSAQYDQVLENKILPNATTGGSVINKSLAVVSKALKYGSQPVVIFVRNDDEYFGADFQLVNIRDIYLEPGKTYAGDCNYIFMNAWYTESDIDAIIASEKELAKDKDYRTNWKLKALEKLKANLQPKDTESQTKVEKRQGEGGDFIKLIHGFQKGINNKFYTFSEDGEVVREWINPDPRGYIPIEYMYFKQDGEHPLGQSAIRLTIKSQDMLDKHLQNYQFQVGLKSAPPTKVWGNPNLKTIQYDPYAVWDMGTNRENDAQPVDTDDTLINTFPTIQGILKGNILNITNNGDTSVSAETGNPGFSKTHAGVRAQEARIDTADNYLRRQFEDWFGRVAEGLLNLHIAAHIDAKKTDVVPLSERYIEAMRKENPEFNAKSLELDYNQLVDENDALAPVKFKVDASSSKLDDDQEQLESLNKLLEIRMSGGDALEPYLKLGPLVYQIVKKSGVPNAEEIAPQQKGELERAEMTTEPTAEAVETVMPAPAQPETLPQPEPLDPADQSLIQELMSNGLSQDKALTAVNKMKQGMSPEQLDQIIGGQN